MQETQAIRKETSKRPRQSERDKQEAQAIRKETKKRPRDKQEMQRSPNQNNRF